MSLTRAEEEFIKVFEGTSRQDQENGNFLDQLSHSVRNGSRASDAGSRINWGSAAFGKEFVERVIAKGNITDAVLFKISEALLDNHTFDQAPLRQVHLFSHLYAELLKKNMAEILDDHPRLPEDVQTLNRKMLLENISLFNKKSGQEVTADCINNFLYMRSEYLGVPKENREGIQQLFFEDVKAHISKNDQDITVKSRIKKFHKKPNTPLPERKPTSGYQKKIEKDFEDSTVDLTRTSAASARGIFGKSQSDRPGPSKKEHAKPEKSRSAPSSASKK